MHRNIENFQNVRKLKNIYGDYHDFQRFATSKNERLPELNGYVERNGIQKKTGQLFLEEIATFQFNKFITQILPRAK